MNYQYIVEHLLASGYSVTFDDGGEKPRLEVSHYISENVEISLVHFCVDEIDALPSFLLKNSSDYPTLAHVLPLGVEDFGSVCVGGHDSVSVNYERPELAFVESLQRHIDLLQRVILDQAWNKEELIREFYSNWLQVCDAKLPALICAASGEPEEIVVYAPVAGMSWGFEANYFGITDSVSGLADFSHIARQGKGRSTAGAGYVLPLTELLPAPQAPEHVKEWYLKTVQQNVIPESFRQKRGRRFWLLFTAKTPSGATWFGLELEYGGKGKKTLPTTVDRLANWKVKPLRVIVFNRERLMPRSGADRGLEEKSVLVVGCGSVGGELAYKLGSAGVGKIVLCDPDQYSVDNIYRHVLRDTFIGCNKAFALSISLDSKYPWLRSSYRTSRLLELRDKGFLSSFDLIVVAIGVPTHERLFHDFLLENDVKTPVINTWLEGYGIGGHAVLDLRDGQGCLRCAYVDFQSGGRGLASNLNFLEPNQDLTVNHAGCGELFIPYSGVSAAQTALIASNLAIGSLSGLIEQSSKVSWKGPAEDVESRGFQVSHRYTAFDKSLQILPLIDDDCDICNG